MLGVFITGPASALLGAILGITISALQASATTATRLLTAAAALVAVITLYFSVPEPRYYADAVEGEILACTAPEDLRDDTVKRLDELAASRPPCASRSRGATPSTKHSMRITASSLRSTSPGTAGYTDAKPVGTAIRWRPALGWRQMPRRSTTPYMAGLNATATPPVPTRSSTSSPESASGRQQALPRC